MCSVTHSVTVILADSTLKVTFKSSVWKQREAFRCEHTINN